MANWQIDTAHTSASFSVRHMMVTTVRGTFDTVTGSVSFDPANPAGASVEAQIEVNSISTGAPDRDNHLRSADFFDIANHPYITFKSTGITLKDQTSGVLKGDLTIRGTTLPVEIEVEFLGENKNPWGKTVAGFVGETKINREDYGLTWNQALETGGVLVGKEIKITLDVEVVLVEEAVTA
jgi:polyisoprenoid-binding protein YceI